MSSSQPPPNSPFIGIISRLNDSHERLKHSVHSYWRKNTLLSPRSRSGKVIMGSVYFSIPVILGYLISIKAVAISESTVEERFGDKYSRRYTTATNDATSNKEENVERIKQGTTTSSWGGGGVNLATSDKDTQNVNKINLERFMKKQRKLKEIKDQNNQEARD